MIEVIERVTHGEAMRRFKYLYRMEKLPSNNVSSAEWYASDISCAALVWVDRAHTKARIKGTVTAPECRGQGAGQRMLQRLILEAVNGGAKTIESFARDPKWYLANGFKTKRVTKWGVTVVEMHVSP
jgi:N-acetylglutamate synthase-like GNAT family acetyltransferase